MQVVFKVLLLAVPVAIVSKFANWSPVATFTLCAVGIVPLAKFLGEATEELAARTSSAVGGLLNATFGNATELIIGILAIREGLIEVVKASLAGSIIGNLLFVLGASIFFGGLKHRKQKFNREGVSAANSTLFLAVIALIVTAVFGLTSHKTGNDVANLSLIVSILLLVVYVGQLIFSLVTHAHLYSEEVGKLHTKWSVGKSLSILAISTAGVAWLSEDLVTSIKPTIAHLGWTELFVGAVVVAIIGNAAEHASAVTVAIKNRMDLSLGISLGSASQIALLVAPVFVIFGRAIGQPMNLAFSALELVAISVAVLLTHIVTQDGESNWLEGLQLLGAYAIIGVAFYFFN